MYLLGKELDKSTAGIAVPIHTSEVNQGSPNGPTSTTGLNVISTRESGDTGELLTNSSRSSTEGSLQNADPSTCHLTDVDNMPIMSATDVERMITGQAQTPPNESFIHISSDAAAIIASTPELNTKADSSSPMEVSRRGGNKQSTERPISLDLENLPEGVIAHSLFAELSSQEPDIIGQVDTGADITAMVGELDTVLKENKELLTAK